MKVSPLPAHGAQGWDVLRERVFLLVLKQFHSQMPFRNHREGSDKDEGIDLKCGSS